MSISNNITKYIENSKIYGKLSKWTKSEITVNITPILAPINNKDFYYAQIERAMSDWNLILQKNNINLRFEKSRMTSNADITIHWTKVGRVFEGMCKYLSVVNGSINKVSIDIGLPNELSGKNTTDLSIFCAIMHELGHSLGLGHGVEVDDIMYVPHQKNISTPSENDIYVLKEIYK